MSLIGAPRLQARQLVRAVFARLRDETGIALVMALGILVVLGLSAASLGYYTQVQQHTTARSENQRDAYSLAEAGMNSALSVLGNALNAKTASSLPDCTSPVSVSLNGGTATYCGVLQTNPSYVWSLTATGTTPSPAGGAPLTNTIHRTVNVKGLSDGASLSAWSRFYESDPNQCMTIDTVTIPGSIATDGCLILKNGGKVTGSTTSVDVGGDVTIVGSTPVSSAKPAGTGAGTGWTTPTKVNLSDNVYATSGTIAANGTSTNLDATSFGFNIPAGNLITGITASIERHELTGSTPVTLDASSSAASAAAAAVTYDIASSTYNATAGTTLSWSHTVANQSNRVLVVGVTAEYATNNLCQATSVTYGAQSLTKIGQSVTSSSSYECASLWYVLAPATGTNTITVTYQSSVTNKTAGAVGLYNVQQTTPDASNTSSNPSGATTTSLTTTAANTMVVDVFSSGQALGDLAPGSGQTVRWTRDSGATHSGGMSTKAVAASGATSVTWTQSGINRSAAVAAAFAPLPTAAATTLAWSHTVANQSNRVLVVGVTAEHTSNSCQASTVTFGAQSLTKIAQNVAGAGPYECTSLWYLLAPTVSTNTITVTYQSSIVDRTAGAVGLYNVKQAAPDASGSNANSAGATSTNITTLVDNSWVVDAFGSGQGLGNLAPASGQTARWTKDSSGAESGGMSTKIVAAAGATSVTWTQTGIDKSAQVAAAFAPAMVDMVDADVYLLKAGAPVGTDHAGNGAWTTSDATVTYGSSSDMWGTGWSLSDVNASNFGVRLAVRNPSTTATNQALVDYVSVTVYYEPIPTGSIGTSTTSVAQANIGGTCTLGSQPAHQPCSSVDNVFATHVTTAAQNLGKPTIDLDYWWKNAMPGPKHPCTTSSGSVPAFDNNASTTTTWDASVQDSGEMTPEGVDYTCQVVQNGTLMGELSWNHSTRVLTIKGTIFRDGDFRFDDDGTVVHYKGRAIIYTSGHVEFDEQVCAGDSSTGGSGSGTTSCFGYPYPSATGGTWDPTKNLMILLSGSTDESGNGASEYDQGGTQCSPSGTLTCPNGYKPSGFQGIVYSNGECVIHQEFQISGPVMCNTITIQNGNNGSGDFGQPSWPTFYSWPNLGSLIDGQIYMGTADAEAFEMDLGPSDG